jgi:hypothetical protein
MELINNGKYFFVIGSFEKHSFQNSILKDSKYLGRFKTKNKYLGLLHMLGVNLIHKKTLKNLDVLKFYNEISDFIIGDVFYIKESEIFDELDKIKCMEKKYFIKENIVVINQETEEQIECFTYFLNCNDLVVALENAKNIVNEYTIDEKIEAFETIIKMDILQGDDTKEEWFAKLQKMKDEGIDTSKLLDLEYLTITYTTK